MTMNPEDRPNDLLLLAGKIASIFMQAAMAIGAFAIAVAGIALLFYRDTLIAEYAAEIGDPTAVFPVPSLLGVMLIGLAMVAALFVFFGKLRQIIATVGNGDPFEPGNADRLNLMAWLMLAVQVLLFPAAVLGTHLASYADELENVNMTGGMELDLTGLLLVIILFILARIFRHGAAMREDLEGTV